MNKEEILAKSREENKNRDLYITQVNNTANSLGGIVTLFLATFFFIIQAVVGKGFNFGLYAIVFSFGAVNFLVKANSLREKKYTILAIVYGAITLILTVVYVLSLLSTTKVR